MPRAGLDTDTVLASAAELADAQGLQQLTLTRLAAELRVRPPSLYAHVDGLEDVRRRLGARGAAMLTTRLQSAAAGRSGRDALRAVAHEHRSFAREHPGLYTAMQRPAPASGPEEGAARELVDVMLAVLRGYGLEGTDALHAVRIVRSALHGFALLESEQGFRLALDLDETYERLVELLDEGLARAHDQPGARRAREVPRRRRAKRGPSRGPA